MNNAKEDSYISTKEEGKDRVEFMIAAYREKNHMPAWEFDKTDSENYHNLLKHRHSHNHSDKLSRRLLLWKRKKSDEDEHETDEEMGEGTKIRTKKSGK